MTVGNDCLCAAVCPTHAARAAEPDDSDLMECTHISPATTCDECYRILQKEYEKRVAEPDGLREALQEIRGRCRNHRSEGWKDCTAVDVIQGIADRALGVADRQAMPKWQREFLERAADRPETGG